MLISIVLSGFLGKAISPGKTALTAEFPRARAFVVETAGGTFISRTPHMKSIFGK